MSIIKMNCCMCERCRHVWLCRKYLFGGPLPKRCAHCKSPDWNKPKKTKVA